MYPLANNVLVEKVEEGGILKTYNEEYLVVKVKQLPPGVYTENGTLLPPDSHITVGAEILVTHLRDFLVNDKKHCFVKIQDIVAVL